MNRWNTTCVASLLLVSTLYACSSGDKPGAGADRGNPSLGTTGGSGNGANGDGSQALGGATSASGGASSSGGSGSQITGDYFEAGVWHGYGYTDDGTFEGGDVSALSGGFSSGSLSACVSGTLAENYSSLGIIGMAVNQTKGSDTLGEWTPGEYEGVQVAITRNVSSPIRMEILAADGTGYCTELSASAFDGKTATIFWSSFKTECWGNNGTAYDPTDPIVQVQFYAPGDVNSAVSFDYCIDTLEPVKDTGGGLGDHKFVGNITTNYKVRSDFINYWDQITPENEGKWGSVEGTRDVYTWDGVDAAYNYAVEHNIPFKQHTFVWGSQYPSWIDSLSPSEQAAEIEEWIKDFCTRYPKTALIDVVNEATPGHAPANYAKSAFGDDWIIKSFQLARKYCPNAVLILNDYNVLTWNTDQFIAMAKPAVDAGVIDAIGLQSHGFENWKLSDLQTNLNKVLGLGLPIYISEYDVDIANDQDQLKVMKEQFTFFYEHPSIKGITLWGYVVGSTWIPNSGLMSDGGTQRPAMTWLMDYLGR